LAVQPFSVVASKPNGCHDLAPNSTSGALDYIRGALQHLPLGCVFVWRNALTELLANIHRETARDAANPA
jgi:hypothetical protein